MKNYLRRMIVIGLLFAGSAAWSLAVPDVRFGFSLSGGMGNIHGGDFNRYIRDYQTWTADYNDYAGEERYTFDWKEMKWMSNFGGEFIARFGEYFGVSLGVEFIKKTHPGLIREYDDDSYTDPRSGYYVEFTDIYQYAFDISQTMTVIPITLNFYGFLPIGPKAEAYVKAGGGYYLGKIATDLKEEVDIEYNMENYWNGGSPYPPHYYSDTVSIYDYRFDLTCNTLGFHFGAGLNYNVSGNIALFAEAFYRMVDFKDWRGDASNQYSYYIEGQWTDEPLTTISSNGRLDWSGRLWFYEDIWSRLATGAYGEYWLYENEPEESAWKKNVRPAEININGFNFKVGIKIFFGPRSGGR